MRKFAFWLVLGLLLPHCGTNFSNDPKETLDATTLGDVEGATTIDSTLNAQEIAAGTKVDVTCTVRDRDGQEIDTPTSFSVSIDTNGNPVDPSYLSGAYSIDGKSITFNRAGLYTVACRATQIASLVDQTPASLKVVPGAPSELLTTIHKTSLSAGNTTPVQCLGRDAYGNFTLVETTLDVEPNSGYTAENGVFRPTTAGSYAVRCALKDGSLKSVEATTVTVTPGPARYLKATLEKGTVAPNEKVSFSCTVTDEFGNEIENLKVQAGSVEGITQDDFDILEVYGTRAGLYTITCTPQEAWVRNVTEIGDTLEIVPGPPVKLEVARAPDKAGYKLSETVELSYRVYDAYGNLIPDAEIDPITLATGIEEISPLTFGFSEENTYNVTVNVKDHPELSEVVTLIVDQTGPVIVITAPKRAAMVKQSSTTVNVVGKVTDHLGDAQKIKSFTINGAQVTLQPNGSFSYPLSGVNHGMNIITAVATDILDQTTKIVQSFYFSTKFHPMNGVGTTPPAALADSLLVKLTAKMVDDGIHDQRELDDLGTLFELVINDLDIFSYLPRPAYSGNGYDVYVENLTYQHITVTLAPFVGGLNLKATIPNFYAEIEAKGPFNPDGSVSASKVNINANINISVVNSQPVVAVKDVTVEFIDFNIDVHWAINWLINFFEEDIKKDIESAFAQVLQNQVGSMVVSFLTQLNLNDNYQIPNFFDTSGPPITLQVVSTLSSASFDQTGGLLGLGTIIYAKKNIQRSALGTLLRDGCLQSDSGFPTFNEFKRIGIGVSVDLLNMALFSIWWNGALTFDVPPSQLGAGIPGFTIQSVHVDMALPPIITDCNGGKTQLQIGDIELDLKLKLGTKDVRLTMYASFSTEAMLGFANDQITLTVNEIAQENLYLELTRADGLGVSDVDQLTAFVKTTALPLLSNLIGGQTFNAFPLPEIDFSAFAPGAILKLKESEFSSQKDFLLIQSNVE
ncbi:MAG: hypothetical protein KC609_17505 [Myxococcales bacterium]|nr:hypothetical protein [Myxococcales bacterium]